MIRPRPRRFFRHGVFPQLVAFEAVARHGSVTRAARELSLAQPTVSCLLRKLSDTVGSAVFTVRDRRMEPTPAGRELLVLCDEIFESFDRLEERLANVLPAEEATAPEESHARADQAASTP